MGKILITGASGHLGESTIRHLLASRKVPKEQIVALVRNEKRGMKFTELGIETRIGSYDDLESLKNAFQDIDKLLAIPSPELDNAKRLQHIFNVTQAAKVANVKHIFNIGLANPEERVFELEDVDLAGEHMIRALDIPFTFLRNPVYLDEIQDDLKSAIKEGKLVSSTNSKPFNYVLRDDLALVNSIVLTEEGHEGKIYDLSNPRLTNYPEIAKILTEITNLDFKYEDVTNEEAILFLTRNGVRDTQAMDFVNLFQQAIADERFQVTSEDILNILGENLTPLKEAIASLLEDK